MASDKAFALIHAKSDFDIIPPYYRLFPQEVSSVKDGAGAQVNLDITLPTTQGRVATFEALVDAMTTHAKAADKNFVVVCHGLHDAKNVPIALGLDLTTATQQKANDFFFETMANWAKKGMSASDATTEEGKVFFLDKGKKITLPAGVLSGLHTKLTALRALKLHRVELRACALGANLPFLRNVRTALGADLMTAPDQHMFFTDTLNLMKIYKEKKGKTTTTSSDPMTDAEFKLFLKRHPNARTFQDGSSSDRFACEVNGTGPRRTVFAATTGESLSWFVEKYIMSGSNYPRRVKAVSFQPTPFASELKGAPYVMQLPPPPMPFSIAAIDLPQGAGAPYALPLESEYVNHLAKVP